MNRWEQIVALAYGSLLMVNFLLLVAGLLRRSRLTRLCWLVLRVEGLFLVLALTPLVLMVFRVPTSPEARLAFLATVLLLLAPLAAELFALAVLLRWWMREFPPPNS
jgi:hypothetical protein